MADERVLDIEAKALDKILEIRAQEPDAAELALSIRIAGVQQGQFGYEMAMIRLEDAGPGDVVEHHGELPVVIPADSVANLRDARLAMSRDLLNPGLTIDNPNSPSPAVRGADAPPLDPSDPVVTRVQQVLEAQVNPAIASHGGYAELVAVEDGTVYLRLGGGCQGCGMATVTLSQGIEQALVGAIPEVASVVDVTDHASGDNPYYEAAKK